MKVLLAQRLLSSVGRSEATEEEIISLLEEMARQTCEELIADGRYEGQALELTT